MPAAIASASSTGQVDAVLRSKAVTTNAFETQIGLLAPKAVMAKKAEAK